ncbi:MAG: transglycosylase domain-containing protein [Clostridia bacterium]|nr:transglycosylase domain-containing protein [Clostridia bacterium]
MKKFKKILIASLVVFISLSLALAVGLAVLLEPNVKISGFATLDIQKLENLKKNSLFYYADGEKIADGAQNREYVSLSEIPSHAQNAFIAVEDKRFYSHNGVDYIRVLGAIKNNLISNSFKEGASTISQQLIKNTHLKSEKTLSRKVQEIRIARSLERIYDKNEILEMYLNALNFGGNIYGIKSASKAFFDKEVRNLSVSDGATLAGIINSPTNLNPFSHYEKCKNRRDLVLKRMYEQKSINKSDYENAKNSEIELAKRNIFVNQYINGALDEASRILNKEKNEILLHDYKIKTYCNEKLQSFAQEIVNANKIKNADISVSVVSNLSDEVLAFASTDNLDAVTLCRQPGSTLKPFASYAPALEKNLIYPCSKILDERTNFNGYSPKNYREKYYGYISAKKALALSLNVPSVKLLESVGVENSLYFMRKMGLNIAPSDNELSLALGGISDGITLNGLCDAYKTLAKNGVYNKSNFLKEIVDKNGKVLFRNKTDKGVKSMGDDTAFLISDMLNECTKSGTAKKIGYEFDNVCAKTGTVGNKNGNTDAYCVAYTPRYSVAVRINAKNGLMDNEISGGNLPTRLAVSLLKFLNDDSQFTVPSSVISVDIDGRIYEKNNEVLIADGDTLPKDRIRMFFSKKNMPRQKYTVTYQRKSILDDFDNFEIVDSLVD